MKKKNIFQFIVFSYFLFSFIFCFSGFVLAATCDTNSSEYQSCIASNQDPAICLAECKARGTTGGTTGGITIPEAPFETTGDLFDKINDIGNLIFQGLLGLAAIFLVVAGFFFVTAGGKPEGLNKARQMLINALIGVAVGFSARGLIAVITNFIKE